MGRRRRNDPIRGNLSRVPTVIDGLRILKLVVINGLGLGRLVWASLFAQSRLCHVVLRRPTVVAPASDTPEGCEIHPLIHEPSPVMKASANRAAPRMEEELPNPRLVRPTWKHIAGNVAAWKSLAISSSQ